MNKNHFIEIFDIAIDVKSKCVFVEIVAVDAKEVIVIPNESFEAKREFYKNAYNDNLVHVMNEKVKIVGFSHGSPNDLGNHI